MTFWNWRLSGLALASCFLAAVIWVKPIGVSTQFVIANGIIWSLFDNTLIYADADNKSGVASKNTYLNKSGGKYAGNVNDPLNYSFVFVLCMALGAWLGKKTQRTSTAAESNAAFSNRWGNSALARGSFAFLGGVLVLYGARLAGGCTSGHMMSGMMQTAVSGYLFAAAAFLTAIPLAIFLYSRRGGAQ